MQSGAGSGEGGAAPEAWTTLVMEDGLREAAAWGEAGTLQALGAGRMAAEAVREAEARQRRDDAGPGEESVLLVEDVRAAPDLAADEEEAGEEEQEGRGVDQEVEEEPEEEEKAVEEAECPEGAEERDEEEAEEGQRAEEVKEERAEADDDESAEEDARQEDEQLQEEEKAGDDSVEDGAEAEAEAAEEEDVEEEVAEEEEAEEDDQTQEAREEGQKEEEARELQEKQEGEEQPEARRGPALSPLEALQALQAELEPVNKEASRSYSRLRLRFYQRRQRHLEHRSTLLRGIPGFWAKAFVNHPQMSALISAQDEGILGYMTDLKVEEVGFPRDCRKILLFFRKNPYFRDEVVVKEYVLRAAGYRPSHSTPIQWHKNYEREAYSRRHHNSSLNFFNWFSDHNLAGSSRIAEIIVDDLWPNPLQYYVRKKAPGQGSERRTGSFKMLR